MFNLVVFDLHAGILAEEGPKQTLEGVDLTMNSGEAHATMGPNGSGKPTLAYAIAGRPKYEIAPGSITLDGVELTDLTADERARQDLSLTVQYPVEVPGVSVANFLHTAETALDGEAPRVRTWTKDIEDVLNRMNLDSSFSMYSANKSLSGGEKKHHGIVQLGLLNPRAIILDEADSGLSIGALRIISEGINRYSAQGDRVMMLTTHYTRILRHIDPTFVHVPADGRIVDQGGCELTDKLETEGYEAYVKAATASV